MAQSLTMRATSLTASAGLLALAVIAAATMRYAGIHLPEQPDPPSITSVNLPPPIAPTITRTQPTPPQRPTEPSATNDDTPAPPANNTHVSASGPPTVDTGPTLIMTPHWLQRPRDLARYYPPQALRREREGSVELDCLVTVTGQLRCSVLSETPTDWGFGAAALRISQDYRMVPATRDGAPIEARYRMHVPFQLSH